MEEASAKTVNSRLSSNYLHIKERNHYEVAANDANYIRYDYRNFEKSRIDRNWHPLAQRYCSKTCRCMKNPHTKTLVGLELIFFNLAVSLQI